MIATFFVPDLVVGLPKEDVLLRSYQLHHSTAVDRREIP